MINRESIEPLYVGLERQRESSHRVFIIRTGGCAEIDRWAAINDERRTDVERMLLLCEFNAAIDLLPPQPHIDDPISRLAPSSPSTDRLLSICHPPSTTKFIGNARSRKPKRSYSRTISLAILISLFTAQR